MIAAEADYATLTVANVKAASVPTKSLLSSSCKARCRSDMVQAVFSDVLFSKDSQTASKVIEGFAGRLRGKTLGEQKPRISKLRPRLTNSPEAAASDGEAFMSAVGDASCNSAR